MKEGIAMEINWQDKSDFQDLSWSLRPPAPRPVIRSDLRTADHIAVRLRPRSAPTAKTRSYNQTNKTIEL